MCLINKRCLVERWFRFGTKYPVDKIYVILCAKTRVPCYIMTSSNGNIFRALLAFCAENSPVTGEFPTQRPVTRSFDVFFDLGMQQQLSNQWRRQWFETPWRSLWRHCNDVDLIELDVILKYHQTFLAHFWCYTALWYAKPIGVPSRYGHVSHKVESFSSSVYIFINWHTVMESSVYRIGYLFSVSMLSIFSTFKLKSRLHFQIIWVIILKYLVWSASGIGRTN